MQGSRRGNAALTTALGLGVVLAFGALAVDLAYVQVANAQLQSAIDAATLAAAGRLDGTAEGLEHARAVAAEIVTLNPVLGGYTLGPDDLTFGRRDEDGVFTPLSASDAAEVDAVRIEAAHDGLGSILAGVAFGQHRLTTAARSVAARPVGGAASEVECYLPFALPLCAFQPDAETNPAPIYATFGPDKVDTIAWAHGDTASKSHIEHQFDAFCTDPIRVGAPMQVNNGQISNQIDHVAEIVNSAEQVMNAGDGATAPWPYEQFPAGPPLQGQPPDAFSHSDSLVTSWGTVLGGPIAIVDAPCDDPDFKGSATIEGFTWGFIYDMRQGNAHEAGFMIQLDFLHEHPYGTDTTPEAVGNIVVGEGPPVLVDP